MRSTNPASGLKFYLNAISFFLLAGGFALSGLYEDKNQNQNQNKNQTHTKTDTFFESKTTR
jgi:hypothetical protein